MNATEENGIEFHCTVEFCEPQKILHKNKGVLRIECHIIFSSQHKKLPFPFELLRDMGISKLDSGQLSITCSYSSYITLSAS